MRYTIAAVEFAALWMGLWKIFLLGADWLERRGGGGESDY